MKSRRWFVTSFVALAFLCVASQAFAQSPSVLYTWPGTGNIQQWTKHFGTNTVSLTNTNAGELTITETGAAGTGVAIIDDFNRVRESSTASGGLDLLGLDFLEFDLGHSGANPIAVQFYVNARSPCCDFVALGPDLLVAGGGVTNTYQVPLTGLTPAQAVYVRTVGFNARDHFLDGNVVWTLEEVRSGGTPLVHRDLVTHNTGTEEGGLEGAIVNFQNTAVQGNDGSQNQTGLSHNSAGSGSLQWTDLGGDGSAEDPSGGAISWGNGTAWAGNTFNNRITDVSNYARVLIRMSATEVTPGVGGVVTVQNFFQTGPNFTFQAPEPLQGLPIDGQFHNLVFSLAGVTSRNVVDLTGVNLSPHATDLRINVDLVRFIVPEPASLSLLGIALVGCLGMARRTRREK